MAKVKRANVILHIDNDEVDRYVSLGYSLINENTGEIIVKGMPTDIGEIKNEYMRLSEENKALKARIKELENKDTNTETMPRRTRSKVSKA